MIGFSIASAEEIDRIKADETLSKTFKKFAIYSIILSFLSVLMGIIAIIYSGQAPTVSTFWIRFSFLFTSTIFWGFSLSSALTQLSINKNIFSFMSIIISIFCSIFLIISIFL